MPASGFALQVASGGRRLTVHCRFCGQTLACPETDLWVWMKRDEVQEFYRAHREHAGALADKLVGAEIEFDDGLTRKEEKEKELPPLLNLLDPRNMPLLPHG
jgi:hypothetical protein